MVIKKIKKDIIELNLIYLSILLLMLITNIYTYSKLQFYEGNPLKQINNLEEIEIMQKIINQNNISIKNTIGDKKSNWVYFYLNFNQENKKVELIKVYEFEDNKKIFEHKGFYEIE